MAREKRPVLPPQDGHGSTPLVVCDICPRFSHPLDDDGVRCLRPRDHKTGLMIPLYVVEAFRLREGSK